MNPNRTDAFQAPTVPARRVQALIFLLVTGGILLSAIALSSGLPGSFLIDDQSKITSMDVPDPTPEAILHTLAETRNGYLGRPISFGSLFISLALHGKSPAAFKVENILLHGIVALLLFWFLGLLLESANQDESDAPPTRAWIFAALVSIAWALHPLQVSTVLYIVQRITEIATAFTLLALISYLKVRIRLRVDGRISIPWLLGTGLFSILGVFSKEEAALIPAYILLIEAVLLVPWREAPQARRKALILTAVLGAAPVILGVVYFATHTGALLRGYITRDFSLTERIATEATIVWHYVQMIVLPRLRDMTLYQDGVDILPLTSPAALVALGAWTALIAALISLRRRYPMFVFGIAFFLVSHAIESTVLPLELAFEHRNYLGSAGLLLAVGSVGAQLARRWPTIQRPMVVALTLAIAMLAFQQWTRASTWRDPRLLLRITVAEHPKSLRATSALANEYMLAGQMEKLRALLDNAIEHAGQHTTTGLRLYLMTTHCHDDGFPQKLYHQAAESLRSTPLQPYAVSGLDSLTMLKRRHSCPALTLKQVAHLTEAGAANRRTSNKLRFIANVNASSASLSAGLPRLARKQLERAVGVRADIPADPYVKANIRLGQVCVALGDRACARASVDRARRAAKASSYEIDGAGRHIRRLEQSIQGIAVQQDDLTGP